MPAVGAPRGGRLLEHAVDARREAEPDRERVLGDVRGAPTRRASVALTDGELAEPRADLVDDVRARRAEPATARPPGRTTTAASRAAGSATSGTYCTSVDEARLADRTVGDRAHDDRRARAPSGTRGRRGATTPAASAAASIASRLGGVQRERLLAEHVLARLAPPRSRAPRGCAAASRSVTASTPSSASAASRSVRARGHAEARRRAAAVSLGVAARRAPTHVEPGGTQRRHVHPAPEAGADDDGAPAGHGISSPRRGRRRLRAARRRRSAARLSANDAEHPGGRRCGDAHDTCALRPAPSGACTSSGPRGAARDRRCRGCASATRPSSSAARSASWSTRLPRAMFTRCTPGLTHRERGVVEQVLGRRGRRGREHEVVRGREQIARGRSRARRRVDAVPARVVRRSARTRMPNASARWRPPMPMPPSPTSPDGLAGELAEWREVPVLGRLDEPDRREVLLEGEHRAEHELGDRDGAHATRAGDGAAFEELAGARSRRRCRGGASTARRCRRDARRSDARATRRTAPRRGRCRVDVVTVSAPARSRRRHGRRILTDSGRFTEKIYPLEVHMVLYNEIVIGQVGSLIKYKRGIDLLIESFARLVESCNNLKLIIVGDGPEKNELDKLSHELGVDDRIRFVGDVKNTEFFYSRLFDINVLASRSEAFPLTLLEGASCCLPNVGSRVGGIPEIIEDGINGFLFEKENVTQLTEKLALLINNEYLRKSMGESGREKIEKYFNIKEYSNKISDVIDTRSQAAARWRCGRSARRPHACPRRRRAGHGRPAPPAVAAPG